ncbi:MAG: citrate lyase acyl carrier protein [Candidatus Excrementavichristensenella sp.]|jgi:citrate lyase subunit gamma (acyl carrier protein)|nr:citrate lyase acyl carrier protein [Bacillota bacterium]NLL54745.1 citrate lyase acyl carrier protein [Clostridiales bacterium]
MTIVRSAVAGTLESSDALVSIAPSRQLEVHVESVVMKQFGDAIEASVRQVLRELSVTGAQIRVQDRGALDCTIRARVETAVLRGGEEKPS